ncbi:T9SS type A sorting domain-containing protein [Roseivirga misakiensis]|nr:SdrD B-like domain-containing protein [Roseivirga misakiensis]
MNIGLLSMASSRVWRNSLFLFILFLSSFSLDAQNPDIFYYVSDGNNRLYSINRSTGAVVDIGPTASNIEALAYFPIPGQQTLYAANGGTFGSVNTSTGAFTTIGDIDGGGTANGSDGAQSLNDVDGLMLDGQSLVLWAVQRRSGDPDLLFQINRTTGQFVADAFGTGVDYLEITGPGINVDVDDLAIDPTTGEIYGNTNSGGTGDQLFRVNSATGVFEIISTLSENDIEGLSFSNDGRLYGSDGGSENRLGEIDIATGVFSNFQTFTGASDVESLAALVADANLISGTVFDDTDRNGLNDDGAGGIEGVTVYLYLDQNNDGQIDPEDSRIQSTVTDVNGDYEFYYVTTGTLLMSTDPATWDAGGTTRAITTDNLETAVFTDGVNFGESDTDNDFGLNDFIPAEDCDGDGLPDFFEGTIDSDGDGIQDQCDLDSDNDGIRDDIEGADDFDDDGIPNYLDRDSDDDGIPDAVEANRGVIRAEFVSADGNLTGAVGTNGIVDTIEGVADDGVLPDPFNSDADIYPDYLDLDSDNDGILDIREGGISTDVDGDGQIDNPVDANNNGYADSLEVPGFSLPNTDESTYETPNGLTLLPNYIDIDSDADGIDDTREGQSTSGYGFPSIITDVDEDGIIDFWDVSSGLNPIIPFDNDFDGTPDYIDINSDNDTESDFIEGNDADFNGVADEDNSGVDANENGLDDVFDPGCVVAGASTDFSLSDHAEEDNTDGSIDLGSSDLELVDESNNQTVGIRFTNVTIDQGASIAAATVQFQTDETSTGALTITIEGQLSDNAAAFTTATNNVSSRTRTMASESWSPADWNTVGEAGSDQRTVDISSIIQEIVGQPGWSNGNSLVLIFTGPSGTRTAEDDPTILSISLAGGPALVCSSNVSLPDEDSDGEFDFRETDGETDSDFDGIPDSIDIDDDNDGITDIDEGGPCTPSLEVDVSLSGTGTYTVVGDGQVTISINGGDGGGGSATAGGSGATITNAVFNVSDGDVIRYVVGAGSSGTGSNSAGGAGSSGLFINNTLMMVVGGGAGGDNSGGAVGLGANSGTAGDTGTGTGPGAGGTSGSGGGASSTAGGGGGGGGINAAGTSNGSGATGGAAADLTPGDGVTLVAGGTPLGGGSTAGGAGFTGGGGGADGSWSGGGGGYSGGGAAGDAGSAGGGGSFLNTADPAYVSGSVTAGTDGGGGAAGAAGSDGFLTISFTCSAADVDTDGDGIVDRLDLDSDNDGILDITEAGGGSFDADNDGRVDNYIEGNGPDGLASVFEPLSGNSSNLPNLDTDNDGLKDFRDLDSDNDGLFDILEAGGLDLDTDGRVDDDTDGDNDGIADDFDINNSGSPLSDPDSDSDGFPNRVDIDSDGDGIIDIIESQASTSSPILPTGNDNDNDGIDDEFDDDDGGTPTVPVDTDGDGTPDYLDLNSDNDGLVDAVEGWDTNGDSSPNTTASGDDTDNDGLDDSYDNVVGPNSTTNVYDTPGGTDSSDDYPNQTTSGTAERDWREENIIDTDLDGIPDSDDIDDDNDGILDIFEANCASTPSSLTNSLNYQFFDGTFTPTVENIPNSSALGSGTVTDFLVNDLQALLDPGDADTYGIRYYGFIEISTSETYTFFTSSDDGSKLFVNGTEVVNNDGDHGDIEASGAIALTPGIYGFEVLFYENIVGASLTVSYESATIAKTAIPFSVLTAEADCDTDGDGIVDRLDLDSDNDGIFDIAEAGGTDVDQDGRVDDDTDTDLDGWADTFDSDNGGTALTDADTDGDGFNDRIDIDSDGDGIVDVIESQATTGTPIVPIGVDSDQDGIDDAFDINCAPCGGTTGVPTVPVNTDGAFAFSDTTPDHLDTDSDNDGLNDIIEGWDTDGNFAPNVVPLGTDADADGLDDAFDNVAGLNSTTNVSNNQSANSFPDVTTSDKTSERDWREINNVTCAPGEVDTNLMLWLRADEGGTNWLDQSNNFVSLIRTGTATVGSMNFNPTNVFNGSTFYTSDLSINASTNPDLAVITVYRPSADDAGAVWGENDGSFDRYQQDVSGENNAVSNGTGVESDIAGLFSNGSTTISSVIFNEDASSGSEVFVNGESFLNFTADHGSESSNNFQIGAIGTGTNQFNGEIAEVIVYNQLLSTPNDRQKIESYLALKYGITLSDDTDGDGNAQEGIEGDYLLSDGTTAWDASDFSNFQNNIAGIVRDDESCLVQLQSKSENSDAIVTIGLDDNDDGLESSNALNESAFGTDLSALVWGHDGAALYDINNQEFDNSQVRTRLNREWRVRETGTIGTVNIIFDVGNLLGPEGVGTNDESEILLLVDADGDFSEGAITVSQSFEVNDDGEVIFQVDLSNGVFFTLGSGELGALPITLLSFAASLNDDQVDINWSTSAEINNGSFRVERSTDGINFIIIQTIAGAGNSNVINEYSIVDPNPADGLNFYRLVDIDFNGIENLSEIVSVRYTKEYSIPKLYPNPAQPGRDVFIDIQEELEPSLVRLYNVSGKQESALIILTPKGLKINTSKLVKGIYVVVVPVEGQLVRFKLLVTD